MDFSQAIKVLENAKRISPSVTIVAATKMVEPSVMNRIKSELGIDIVGENKVQELLSKYEQASNCDRWHIIGQLQTNKVKYIADKVEMIQSVDRLSLAQEIQKQCAKLGKVMKVLVEVNMADEESKGGVTPNNAIELVESISKLENVKVEGLMSVLPNLEDQNLLASYYKKLYNLFEELKRANISGVDAKYLSAGMSGDYALALESGANMIRLGSCLFGRRNYN